MYDFIRGPLVWVAFLVFILGTVYQVYRFYQLSRPKARYLLRVPFGKPPKDPDEPPDEPPLGARRRFARRVPPPTLLSGCARRAVAVLMSAS